MSVKRTLEEYLVIVKEHFGDRFDFSQTVWPDKPSLEKITIICPQHGEFHVVPSVLFRSPEGCPKCTSEKSFKKYGLPKREKYFQTFLKKAKAKFGSKFDFSLVEYINGKTPVTIRCPQHGEFQKAPLIFLQSKMGCSQCGKEFLRQTIIQRGSFPDPLQAFLLKVQKKFSDKLKIKEKEFKDRKTPLTIVCREHGEFTKTPKALLLSKHGCSECAKKMLSKMQKK